MRFYRRHAHLEIKTTNGRWIPYCRAAAFSDFPKGIPSVFEVICMEGNGWTPTLEEMREVATTKYGLEVRVAEGICPTYKGQ